MFQFLDNEFHLVLSVMVFVSVTMMLEGLYLVWRSYRGEAARQVGRRLQALAHEEEARAPVRASGLGATPLMERLLRHLPRAGGLQRFLRQAGLGWSVSTLLLASLTAALLAWAAARALQFHGLPALLLATAGSTLPAAYVQYRRAQRLGRIERQLPDALDLLGRALRAGHAFSAGLQMVGEEMPEPIAGEFRFTHDEINYGVATDQALSGLARRVPVPDLAIFVVAVLIQRESGGNLTEVLGNLAHLIRERLKLHARVRVLSAEGRLSALILVVMPFAMGALLAAFNPAFMRPLWTDPIGQSILRALLVMMIIGVLMLRKIVRVRV
ncbi:MAG: type II secretion system F family protein [Telluria sp.]